MRAPLNINILPTDSEAVKAIKKKLNDHIIRVDECYRLLRSDLATLSAEELPLDDIYVRRDGTSTYTGTGVGYKDEDDMASDSDVATASQQSIKAYVDSFWDYILASPRYTVFYLDEDLEGNPFIERVEPEEYGMVFTCGGLTHPPFWAWVYEEPGADFGGRIWFTSELYARVQDASIISMDAEKLISTSGKLDAIQRDNYNDPNRFTNSTSYGSIYRPSVTAELQDASIITMDVTSDIEVTMINDTSDFLEVTSSP